VQDAHARWIIVHLIVHLDVQSSSLLMNYVAEAIASGGGGCVIDHRRACDIQRG